MSKRTPRPARKTTRKPAPQTASKQPTDDERAKTDSPSQPPADVVDEASDESFPASDPPAWTETTASKNNARH